MTSKLCYPPPTISWSYFCTLLKKYKCRFPQLVLGGQEVLLHAVLGYWTSGWTHLILSSSKQLQNTPIHWHWEVVSIHDLVMPVSPRTHKPLSSHFNVKYISWFCFHTTIMKFTVKYLSYDMKKLRLLDIWLHIQPNFSKHLKYSSPIQVSVWLEFQTHFKHNSMLRDNLQSLKSVSIIAKNYFIVSFSWWHISHQIPYLRAQLVGRGKLSFYLQYI